MQVELLCRAKYRLDAARPGDDVPLVLPGAAMGVFDGATDARATVVEGIPAGRFAALTVAQAAAALLLDRAAREMPGPEIVARLSAALAARTAGRGLPIPPSTTLALAIDCGAEWRLLALGDSGIRLNGSETLRTGKIIDDVATHARIAVFRHLRERMDDPDAAEMATRRAIFLGLGRAAQDGVVPAGLSAEIVRGAAEATGLAAHAGSVADFLSAGICAQYRYGNAEGDPLCFDTMDGGTPKLGQLTDTRRPKEAVRSIEIFSDGYPAPPPAANAAANTAVSIAAWEALHAEAEARDFHKTGDFPSVKGATSTEFFDDRTVVIAGGA